MRLLQLNTNGNDASALDFHPMVTVVHGLTPAGRDRVIQAVTSLPRGTDPGCHGLLEAHGILLDLNPAILAMLDYTGDLDVLIRPSDIPGAAPAPSSVTSVLPAAVEPLSVEAFLAVTPEGRYPELDEARARHAQSAEALVLLQDAADRARDAHREAIEKLNAAQAALDSASSAGANLRLVVDEPVDGDALDGTSADVEPDDTDDAFAIDDDLLARDDDDHLPDDDVGPTGGYDTGTDDADADPLVGTLLGPEPVEDGPTPDELRDRRRDIELRLPDLQAVVDRVDRGIDELAALDPRPVQVLVDAIRSPAPVEFVPSERGAELADEFVRLQAEVKVLEEGLAARGMDTPSAMARLDLARDELTAAEKAMRPPEYTDADRLALEAAHDEMLEAEKKGRGRGGKKRFEEALVAEQAILDRMGFPTWSAYVMGAGLMGIDPAAEQRLEKARFELEAAEQHWSDVTAMIEADPVHRELLDQLENLYLEAFDLLGGDDGTEDLELKLRTLEVPKQEVSTEELVDALLYQLELLGMKVPPEMTGVDRVVMVAEAFLEEASAIVNRLNELGTEKVDALTEIEQIEAELATIPSDEELDAAEVALEQARIDAEQARAEAEARAAAEQEAAEAQRQAEQAAAEQAAADRAEAEARAAELEAEARRQAEARAAASADAAVASAAELAETERAYQIAAEEEGEYADFVEAREALLEAAIQVDAVATSRLEALASELAQREADEAGAEAARSDAPATAGVLPESDAAFANVEGVDASSEAVEFYLLSRLAALRTVSYAGSVPLLIDDALAGKPRKEVEQLLHKLERMSESVQIIYLSDDDAVTGWADGIGFERAAVVAAPATFA